MTVLSEKIAALFDEMVKLRRDIHRHPELGLEEVRTGGLVAEYLTACGMEVSRCHETGVVGVLRGAAPGPVLMLRADMDALRVQEETGLPFASENEGVMHACGHDAHVAILLVAAKILAGMRDELPGTVKFVFQPNEEEAGAKQMIDQGVMDGPPVDACMGLHVWNQLPLGVLGVQAGAVMAGMHHFTLTIHGRGGHTAAPHEALDPVLTAAAVIQGVQALQTRETSMLTEPMVIMFGRVRAGTASNVIPDSAVLEGTLRYLYQGDDEGEDGPRARFERVVAGICAAHRNTYDLEFTFGHPTLVNDADMSGLVRDTAAQTMADKLIVQPMSTLAGEDFSEFACRVPSVFSFLGAGFPGRPNPPHHHPRFDIDERVLPLGVEMQVRAALNYLAGGHAGGDCD